MARFELYYVPRLLPFEGGYVFDKDDKGGETYKGIARNANPNWIGWQTVDAWKRRNGDTLPKEFIIPDAKLDAQVKALYKNKYWDALRADYIDNQTIAEIMVDFYVNGGFRIAPIQRFLKISADGAFGPKTLAAINATANPAALFEFIKQLRRDHYDSIVRNDPTQQKFYRGWTRRVESFFF